MLFFLLSLGSESEEEREEIGKRKKTKEEGLIIDGQAKVLASPR